MLTSTNAAVPGADDFLPVLIYVLIHANPPQLASNLMYIERFRMHSRMMSESAYFFTQLVRLWQGKSCTCSAVTIASQACFSVLSNLQVQGLVSCATQTWVQVTDDLFATAVLGSKLHRDNQQRQPIDGP